VDFPIGIFYPPVVIPKSDSEGDRQRDLTMRLNHHGRKVECTVRPNWRSYTASAR
jgi:hypothetical protein